MNKDNIEHIRHSLAHLLGASILELYPGSKITLGPAIDNGFYYDAEVAGKITDADLSNIESKMKELAKSWSTFERKILSKEEALEYYKDNPYKIELINEIADRNEDITIYQSSNFSDLCRGGHVDNIRDISLDSFKLDRVAGAYWRGNEKNKMLTRVYGLAFESKEKLDEYIVQQEEAKKRDHRKIGKELDLFSFSEYIGSGLPLYTPKGAFIRMTLNQFVEDLQTKADYTQVWTPQIVKAELFKISGHYDKYKDDMFKVTSNYSEEEFYLKPMNCPQHTQIYASQMRSYRDLPLRYTDFAMLYRDERPGELNGLARVRSFSQDDCHIFCREDQVDEEIDKALSMTKKVMETFGFKYRYRLSTRDKEHPEKYLGNPETWDKVEKWSEKIMERNKIEYFPGPGEAAFYAPKMDLLITDAIGREWQLSTVQIDYVMPERFNLSYIDKDGKEKRPVMLHRAIIGSSERFMMILIEQLNGNLPVWLSPVQVVVLPISEKQNEYAKGIFQELKNSSMRVELDNSSESLGKRIRNAKMQKIPYLVVVGDKEKESNTITVEGRHEKLELISSDQFIEKLNKEITEKTLN